MADPWFLRADSPADVERYLLEQSIVTDDALPIAVERAGAGNMNLTLRVRTASGRSLIVKQGRPWVEKYPHIPAPPQRTTVEAAFYRAVAVNRAVASMMPAVLHVDARHHVLVLEDLGAAADCTTVYRGHPLPPAVAGALLEWLESLGGVAVGDDCRQVLVNREMRTLNHLHIFDLPLRPGNGLDLDAITPGLAAAARRLSGDHEYCAAVAALGRRYLSDGDTLVHGDYFPGSWLDTAAGVRVIDPEFCFLGDPEFDYGVMAAHLTIGATCGAALRALSQSVGARRLDVRLVAGYAGVEIMRRLIGVAQLPWSADIDSKRSLLEISRRLVLEPATGLA